MAKRVTKKRKVRVAFIGAGDLANAVHYPSLAEMHDVEIVALADLFEEKREETARRWNVKRTFPDYRSMLDAVRCDAVYCIMQPHHLFDIAVDVLKRGHHLFIEKPPAITTFQTQSLARHAKKSKCVTQVGFNRRFAPLNVLGKKLVERAGAINQCKATFHKFSDIDGYCDGAIDILRSDAVHAVDLLRFMGGEVKTMASVVSAYGQERPNAFNAVMRFQSGATGILSTNWMTGARYLGAEMHAPGASAYIETEVAMTFYDGKKEKRTEYDAAKVAESDVRHHVGGYFGEDRDFIDAIKAGRPAACPLSDAVKTMALVDRIYAAAL